MRKAVIDVGSNSVLLVVGKAKGGQIVPIAEASRVTGLGEGTKATGLLSEAAINRTLAALRDFFVLARSHGAMEIRAAATMAARIARNSADFQQLAALQETPVEILSGEDEAELGFRAVAEDPLFASSNCLSIIDPGGNSTELVTAERNTGAWHMTFQKSFPIGTLGLRDGPLMAEVPNSSAILSALRQIDATIGLEYLPGASGTVAVLGASGTNLVTVKKQLAKWDPEQVHGERLEFEEVSRAAGWLCGMNDAMRGALVGLEPGREKTIHIGALILERFMHAIHAEEVIVSVRGWRHALLEKMFESG